MIKPLGNGSKTTTVSMSDSAIDQDATDSEALVEAITKDPSAWREHVKMREGHQPTVFVIGSVPVDELVRLQAELSAVEPSDFGSAFQRVSWQCFLHGLRDIENIDVKVEHRSVNGFDYVSPAWIRDNFNRGLRAVGMEIGARIWQLESVDRG